LQKKHGIDGLSKTRAKAVSATFGAQRRRSPLLDEVYGLFSARFAGAHFYA
jgi:hypothetical protein